MRFDFIAKHRSIWPVAWLCEALGVSRSGFHAWCVSACNFGSDAHLVRAGSTYSDDAGLTQVDFPTPVHLAFDELEFADLAFGLAV